MMDKKYLSLLVLVFQNVSLVLMIRYSRVHTDDESGQMYVASTAVVAAEVLKILVNLVLEFIVEDNRENCFSRTREEILSVETFKLSVPGILYVIQNNLLFVALSNLSAPVFQVTSQGKILATAVCSRILLYKVITNEQYFSLLLLTLGVAAVQLSSMEENSANSNAGADQNHILGFIAVVISCFTSGFAGVYFEKVLKHGKKISLYLRNVQLAIFGVAIGMFPVIFTDYTAIAENGFFAGYTMSTWMVIVNQALGGLLVSLVMKYADNILKGFATSAAIIVGTGLSTILFGTSVDWQFGLGALMVICAIYIYAKYPPKTPAQHAYDPVSTSDTNRDLEISSTHPDLRRK